MRHYFKMTKNSRVLKTGTFFVHPILFQMKSYFTRCTEGKSLSQKVIQLCDIRTKKVVY
jgi:hypothetical protein